MYNYIKVKLKKDGNYNEEEKKIIMSIVEAREEMVRARKYFEIVNDPMLVDYAIYTEQAARAKYMYLLNIAKNKNIKIKYCYMLKEINAV
ncbi:YaaL family protein [Clostridium rectalis]|uniref:YaaL family protein n=1 Tax=Clostridium rectalis TaxID=2040295 RepID=UPI000F63C9A3|nr:YaaL family protein [Clostridium rectalis]